VLIFVGAAFVRLLESTNRQRVITKISLICVIVNILLNLMLIPKLSYVGSSIATVLTEFVLVGSVIIFAYRTGYGIPLSAISNYLLKIMFSSLVMCAFVLYLRHLQVIVLIASAGMVYFVSLYLVRGLDDEDILLFRQATGR